MPLATPLLSDHVHEEVEDVESTGGAKTVFGCLLLMAFVVIEIIKFIQEDGMNMPAQGMNSDSSMVSVTMSVSHNETLQLVASQRTTDTRIPDMIMDPDEMYSEGGMVSPPVWIMTIRAFLIFGAQQACLFVDGGAPLEWDTVVDFFDRRMGKEGSGRLGKLSIIFQIIGQGIVVFSWTAVFRVVQPMEANQRLEAFALLVSQHIASVIVVVGLTNNLFMSFYAGSREECFNARWLSCTGFLVGLPLWISLASVGFPYNIESIIIVLVCSALAVLVAVAINRCMQRKIAWRAMAINSLRGLVDMLNQALRAFVKHERERADGIEIQMVEGQMTTSETMRKKMVVRRDLIEGSPSLVSQPQTPRASGKCKPGPTEETPSADEKFQKAPKEAASPKKEAAKRDATPKEEHHHHHHSEGRHHHHHGDHHHHKDSHHTDSIAASPPASARHHHHHHHGQSRHGHSDQDFQCTAKLDFEQTSRASPAPRCLQEDAQHKASPPPGAKDPRAVAAGTRHYRRLWHSAVGHLRGRHWHKRGHTHRNGLVKHGTSDADTESQETTCKFYDLGSVCVKYAVAYCKKLIMCLHAICGSWQANPTFAEICEKVQEYGGQVFQAIYEDVNQKFYLHLKLILIFGPFGLSLWWLYMGASTQPLYSFMNFSGLFSALILPFLAIVSCRESPFSEDGVCYARLMAFSTGLAFIYLYCMIIPTAILTAHGHTADAAPLAFWGKKLQAYLTYTFKFPTATAATTTGDLATKHWRVVAVWGSEFLGLPPIILIISVAVRWLCEVGPRRLRLMGALTNLTEQASDRLRGIWIRLAIGPSLETYFAHHQDRAHLARMQQIISNRIHELEDTSLAGLQP